MFHIVQSTRSTYSLTTICVVHRGPSSNLWWEYRWMLVDMSICPEIAKKVSAAVDLSILIMFISRIFYLKNVSNFVFLGRI
jgi:hypothetical protein